ncbi:MAG: DUF3791 domain-containing protein [Cardiobacteriaceae bacterium]|nr:DUF3791 domain-containing protein [Cardiobacteriaceae bacterium]
MDIEKIAILISWCIEEYAAQENKSSKDTVNLFKDKNVLSFLQEHYDVLHTRSKEYIFGTIDDVLRYK